MWKSLKYFKHKSLTISYVVFTGIIVVNSILHALHVGFMGNIFSKFYDFPEIHKIKHP